MMAGLNVARVTATLLAAAVPAWWAFHVIAVAAGVVYDAAGFVALTLVPAAVLGLWSWALFREGRILAEYECVRALQAGVGQENADAGRRE